MKAYVILGDNKDTQGLIDQLRARDNGTITVVDEDFNMVLSRKGDVTYVNGSYVDNVKDLKLPFVYYHYIQPMHRRDGRKWRRSLSSER
ncbi:hypothetical protein [Sporosarcina sp. JAI121]|uniref:hypothetical protein n=1 Tax=Sporosarcina sp. JAI121 TaxID=2723064 RepID=UPI0015C7E3EE|nr:hypothetical protein [Sporosarcina sp. JAI121]NYF23661.1 hypothetical protein [Sporosarcina sp. JAI121]